MTQDLPHPEQCACHGHLPPCKHGNRHDWWGLCLPQTSHRPKGPQGGASLPTLGPLQRLALAMGLTCFCAFTSSSPPVGAADKETAGGGPGSLLPGCIHGFTCQGTGAGTGAGPQRAGRSQPLSCLPVPLAGGWVCGHPLPRADTSRSGMRSSGQCCPLSGQGGPSCPGSEGLAFPPPPTGLGVPQRHPCTRTFPVAHPSSFGEAGLAQQEPTWLAR